MGDSAGEWSRGLCGLRDLSAVGAHGLATAVEAEAPAPMFSRWLSNAVGSATVTDGAVSSGDDAPGAGDYVFDHNDSGNWIFSP